MAGDMQQRPHGIENALGVLGKTCRCPTRCADRDEIPGRSDAWGAGHDVHAPLLKAIDGFQTGSI
ncbi:hypothetical protein GALL_346550 [mine drainage metagenome]|uniref:Uncharacterized protein n=1 Tax=mine drainage metagenome TaxID=410659 RepID=A0A1J5QJ37_9ZZZZ